MIEDKTEGAESAQHSADKEEKEGVKTERERETSRQRHRGKLDIRDRVSLATLPRLDLIIESRE